MSARPASSRQFLFPSVAIVAALAGACSVSSEAPATSADKVATSQRGSAARPAEDETQTTQVTKATTQNAKRMVIRNASLHITTEDPAAGAKEAAAIAASVGGFVLNSQSRGTHGRGRTADLSLRIPSASYDTAFDRFRALGEVDQASSTGEDVTEEFVDLSAQLRSQLALEVRVQAMLVDTKTLDEALRIQNELTRVRTVIERIEGRARFLEEHAAMSTFVLHLASNEQPAPPRTSESVGSRIRNAFGAAGAVLLSILLGGIRSLGVVLPLALFGILGLRVVRGRRKRPPES